MDTLKYRRCVSFCTARSYNLVGLNNSLKHQGFITRLSRDVLQLFNPKTAAAIFFFNHGSFVCWGWTRREEQYWVNYLSAYAIASASLVTDQFCFCYGDKTTIDAHERFKLDVITLEEDAADIKLAISYGLAQSIKLEVFEDTTQEAIRKNGALPEEIASFGRISLSRRALFKRIGEIFIARSSINLSSEYLDTPEFFWRNPNLEPFYMMVIKFLDIPSRLSALNQKLEVLQELLHILDSQLQHRHSSMLEMVIIILIFIEIMISLLLH